MQVKITHIDTACCLINLDNFVILTDPVFDDPGKYYHHGFGAISKKTDESTIKLSQIPKIDLILLSHSQHMDNFDKSARIYAHSVPLILSTEKITKKYKNSKGLTNWGKYSISLPAGATLTITATPARHHPWWLPEFFSGKVIGFILEHSNLKESIYITGDTVYYKGIIEVVNQFQTICISLIHVGSAQFRYLSGFGQYTMNRKGFMKCVRTLNPKTAIPIHNNGWTHFKENDEGIRKELEKNADIKDKIQLLTRGQEYYFDLN